MKGPNGWTWGIGEANRPLSSRGYYMHYASRRIWANQYRDRFYEIIVDTVNMPPTEHVLVMDLREEDMVIGDSYDLERIASHRERVIDPEREASQRDAERRIHAKAEELMAQYPGDN